MKVKFTTNHGNMIAELYEGATPKTVANFVNLIKEGFSNSDEQIYENINNISSSTKSGAKQIHSIPDINIKNLEYIQVQADWRDQGWGHRKGRLFLNNLES